MMKFKVLLLIWFGVGFHSPVFAQGGGGTSVGNGGDDVAAAISEGMAEFYQIFVRECEQRAKSIFKEEVCSFQEPLKQQMRKTKILTDYIVYGINDGRPRDAVNGVFDEQQNFVTYSLRSLYQSQPAGRRRVILHEFATLAGLETSDSYAQSSLILLFLKGAEGIDGLFAQLPIQTKVEKLFRGDEAIIRRNQERYLVLLTSGTDYQSFCHAKGFDSNTSSVRDLSVSEWMALYGRVSGAVVLNQEGVVVGVNQTLDPKARVIEMVGCR